MRRFWILAFVTLLLAASSLVFGQSSNGTISGTVADASGGVLPGVTVTATKPVLEHGQHGQSRSYPFGNRADDRNSTDRQAHNHIRL